MVVESGKKLLHPLRGVTAAEIRLETDFIGALLAAVHLHSCQRGVMGGCELIDKLQGRYNIRAVHREKIELVAAVHQLFLQQFKNSQGDHHAKSSDQGDAVVAAAGIPAKTTLTERTKGST